MISKKENLKSIWLSHILTKNTPGYGGQEGIRIEWVENILVTGSNLCRWKMDIKGK